MEGETIDANPSHFISVQGTAKATLCNAFSPLLTPSVPPCGLLCLCAKLDRKPLHPPRDTPRSQDTIHPNMEATGDRGRVIECGMGDLP